MATSTVRLPKPAHDSLRDLASDIGESLSATLTKAIECYRRQVFFDKLDAQYAALQADPVAWADYLREQEEWDVTLMDGLEDDEWTEDE